MRRYLPFFVVAAVGLLTLGTGTMLYRAKWLPILAVPRNSTAPETAGSESPHVRGGAKAPVTLEEFGVFSVRLVGRSCLPDACL